VGRPSRGSEEGSPWQSREPGLGLSAGWNHYLMTNASSLANFEALDKHMHYFTHPSYFMPQDGGG